MNFNERDPMHPRIFYRACLAALALLVGLAGCADTHWERAFYQGASHASAQCQIRRNPMDAPCPALTDYSSYERERAKAKGGPLVEQQP
jgi:hypothetical protein